MNTAASITHGTNSRAFVRTINANPSTAPDRMIQGLFFWGFLNHLSNISANNAIKIIVGNSERYKREFETEIAKVEKMAIVFFTTAKSAKLKPNRR